MLSRAVSQALHDIEKAVRSKPGFELMGRLISWQPNRLEIVRSLSLPFCSDAACCETGCIVCFNRDMISQSGS
jgi:hypothetical protein